MFCIILKGFLYEIKRAPHTICYFYDYIFDNNKMKCKCKVLEVSTCMWVPINAHILEFLSVVLLLSDVLFENHNFSMYIFNNKKQTIQYFGAKTSETYLVNIVHHITYQSILYCNITLLVLYQTIINHTIR